MKPCCLAVMSANFYCFEKPEKHEVLAPSSVLLGLIGSLSTRAFETGTTTQRDHFECQDSGVSHIFTQIISNGENILGNVNVVV